MSAPRLSELYIIREGLLAEGNLYDHFSPDEQSFYAVIGQEMRAYAGPNWKDVIDQAHGWKGAADWMLKQFWDGNWSDYEALSESMVFFDAAQQGQAGYYPWMALRQGQATIGAKYELDATGNVSQRKVRPSLAYFQQIQAANAGGVGGYTQSGTPGYAYGYPYPDYPDEDEVTDDDIEDL